MNLNLNILSEEEKLKIHGDSLKILGEIGVKFMSRNAYPKGSSPFLT